MKKLLFTALVLCLSLLGTSRSSFAAQSGHGSADDPIAKMQAQGWKIVGDGVLQRERRAGEVETFVYGVGGFTWKLQDLWSQLANLRKVFLAHPTDELRQAILNHRKEIASTQEMLEAARAAAANGETGLVKDSCTITYTYNADAGYFTSSQGTYGSASASFYHSCGASGEVYAYATASVTVSGATTTQTVSDGPRDGSNVTASAYASELGIPICSSYAYSSVTSNSLNPSSYSRSASNSSCPASNPVPTISGTDYIYVSSGCTTTTWTSSVSGGTSPYTYQWTWNGSVVGTGSSYSRTVCAGSVYSYTSNTLALTVTDSNSYTGSTSLGVDVEKDPASRGCLAVAAPDGSKIIQCPQ
ncbi:MAG TPA: hypothetical protein VGH73_07910 [Thermoanaerobaculia bacterium]|jgi:hypothetical protein